MNELGMKVDIKTEDEKIIFIDYKDDLTAFYSSFHPILVSILTNHVIATREVNSLKDILRNIFLYKDEDEMEQIIGIARSILEGDRDDIPSLRPYYERASYIYDAFAKGIDTETTLYYEPFLTFRLKDYAEMLIDCVEIAIDEYVLEQEYQNLVENFRYYIKSQEKRMDKIFLVHQKDRFIFYDGSFEKITKEKKRDYLVKHLLFEHDLDINDMVITPLVSFNPKEVIVYTNEEDHNVIYTIQTIFEERVKILTIADFYEHFTNTLASE